MRAFAILATALLAATLLPATATAAHSGPVCTHEYFDYIDQPVWVVVACTNAALRFVDDLLWPCVADKVCVHVSTHLP